MKISVLFLLTATLLFAQRPHSGLWEQIHQDEHFYTEIFFMAEPRLGRWIFEYTSYLVDLDGNSTDHVATSQYLSGQCYRAKGKHNAILICNTDTYTMNGKCENFIDENNNKPFRFAFRLTSPITASFGRLMGNDIFEAYYFVRRQD